MGTPKKPADDFNKSGKKPKKRRFLTNRFPNAMRGNLIIVPLSALIFLDGGLSLFAYTASIHGLMTLAGAPDDARLNKVITRKNDAQQNIKAPVWAHKLHHELQAEIYLAPEKKKTQKRLKKAFKLASDLEAHLTVVDSNGHEITGEKAIYLKTKPEVVKKVIIKAENKLDSNGMPLKKKASKGFDL